MEKCSGIIGKIFGHNFVSIYDTKENTPSAVEIENLLKKLPRYECSNPVIMQEYYVNFIKSLKSCTITYVNSVCERCGTLKHAR